jgi:hypothetical protein
LVVTAQATECMPNFMRQQENRENMVEEFSEIDSSKMLGSAPNPRPVLNEDISRLQ